METKNPTFPFNALENSTPPPTQLYSSFYPCFSLLVSFSFFLLSCTSFFPPFSSHVNISVGPSIYYRLHRGQQPTWGNDFSRRDL